MKIVVFDCDSTLSSIEGIDELARLAGSEVFRQVEDMTRRAMEGEIPLEEVFRRRLELISPNEGQMAEIGRMYLQTVEPEAVATLALLRSEGWTPMIVSGGLVPAIRPLADFLGISEVWAVPVHFDHAGSYAGFDADFPAARSGGKPVLMQDIRRAYRPEKLVMVGDGVSDLETKPEVDLFVGFGRYADRSAVRKGAGAFMMRLSELPVILKNNCV
jgi:phosphoserine phosphatase